MVEGTKLGKSVTEGRLVCEVNLKTFEKKNELRKSALFFVKGPKLLEHCVASRKELNKVKVGRRDTRLNEPSEGTVVASPDIVSLRRCDFVGAREGLVKPGIQAMTEGDEGKLTAPFYPVGLAKVEDEIRGPVGTVE